MFAHSNARVFGGFPRSRGGGSRDPACHEEEERAVKVYEGLTYFIGVTGAP